jgi:hypothetical protein
MKKVSRGTVKVEKPEITIGLDLGDRFSHYCMLNGDGDAIESGRIQTTEEALLRHFEGEPKMRFALEGGAEPIRPGSAACLSNSAASGGKRRKKRAIVAVARKLAVLLHRLWITGDTYHPLYNVAISSVAP